MKRWRNVTSAMLATPCLVCLALPAWRRGFCPPCEEELPWQPPGCHFCGVALTGARTVNPALATADTGGTARSLCPRCSYQSPNFTRCHCTFAYEPPISTMIRRIKDHAGFVEFRALSNCFIEHFVRHHLDTATPWPDLLLPVPLHPSRLRIRGFNQALLLARRLSRRTGIPVLQNSCARQPGTSQRGLNATQRLLNMKSTFRPGTGVELAVGRRLAIIDDVVTTTATTQAMAAVLRDSGATRIDVWALARSNQQPES